MRAQSERILALLGARRTPRPHPPEYLTPPRSPEYLTQLLTPPNLETMVCLQSEDPHEESEATEEGEDTD